MQHGGNKGKERETVKGQSHKQDLDGPKQDSPCSGLTFNKPLGEFRAPEMVPLCTLPDHILNGQFDTLTRRHSPCSVLRTSTRW